MGAFQLFDPYAFLAHGGDVAKLKPPEAVRGLAALAGLAPVEERPHDLTRSCAPPSGSALAAFADLAGPKPHAELQPHDVVQRSSAANPAKVANWDLVQP